MKFFFFNILSKKEKKIFFPILFLVLLSSLLEIISIGLLIPIFDLILKTKSYFYNNFFEYYINNFGYSKFIFYFMLIFFFIFTFRTFFLIISSYIQLKFIKNLNINVSNKLLEIYLSKPFIYYLKNNTNFLVQNINEVNSITLNVRSQLIFFSEILVFLGIILLLIINSPVTTLIILLIFILFGYCIRIFIFNKTKIFGQKRLLANQKRLKNLHEGFDGIREIKIFGLSNYFLQKFLNINTESNTFEFKNTFNLLLPRYLLEWLLILLSLILLFLFFYLNNFINFERSISLLALFCVAMLRLIPSLLRIIQSMQQIKYTDVVVKNVSNEFKEQIKTNCLKVKIKGLKKISFKKYLSLENLNFGYDNKKEIISNLNIKISFGKFLGISGDSGSGKTTLLSIILGLLKPDKGNIVVDDISIFDNVSDWQNQIAYVPQNLYLIDDTIQNNIVLGSLEDNINFDLLKKSIDIACLKELINELPEGLKTNIGEKGINLSGGQRQRIGIARAIYRQPQLLLLDEFTNALDKELEQKILNNIYELKNTVTGIIVSHDYSVIKKCDMFINLNK